MTVTVYIFSKDKLLGKTILGKNGTFKTTIPLQKKGTKVSVYLVDASEKKSC
ncbi:Ig-like domain-containing protein [Gottfriedia endophytica]|uniref:Ig-like domain-containing protein n=1 Tax=Gottfriedia endophytica TaxID=2820819 RepID=UPI00389924ED